MTRPAHFQQPNIVRSITSVLGDSIMVDAKTVPVLHNYAWGDPEEARQPSQDPDPLWIATTWLEMLAGRQGANILQVDVFSRVGAPGTSHHDPFGMWAHATMDEVESLFCGLRPGGGRMYWFPVYDYGTDLDNPDDPPLQTDYCLVMQAIDGRPGQPDSRLYLGVENGYHRITARLRFLLVRDMVRGAGFMTE